MANDKAIDRLKRPSGFTMAEFIDFLRNGSAGVAEGRYLDNLGDIPYTNEEIRAMSQDIAKTNSIPIKLALGSVGAIPGLLTIPGNIPIGALLAILGATAGVKIGTEKSKYLGTLISRDLVSKNQSRRDFLNIGTGAKTLK